MLALSRPAAQTRHRSLKGVFLLAFPWRPATPGSGVPWCCPGAALVLPWRCPGAMAISFPRITALQSLGLRREVSKEKKEKKFSILFRLSLFPPMAHPSVPSHFQRNPGNFLGFCDVGGPAVASPPGASIGSLISRERGSPEKTAKKR